MRLPTTPSAHPDRMAVVALGLLDLHHAHVSGLHHWMRVHVMVLAEVNIVPLLGPSGGVIGIPCVDALIDEAPEGSGRRLGIRSRRSGDTREELTDWAASEATGVCASSISQVESLGRCGLWRRRNNPRPGGGSGSDNLSHRGRFLSGRRVSSWHC